MSRRVLGARQTKEPLQCGPGGGRGRPSTSLDERQIFNGILEKQLKICGYKNDKEVTDLYLGENGLKDVPDLSQFRKLRYLWLNHNKDSTFGCIHKDSLAIFWNITNCFQVYGLTSGKCPDFARTARLILLLHNNQLKNLDMTVKELQGLQTLHTLNLFNNPLSQESRYRLYVIYHIPSVTLFDRKEITRKERESALHIYNHEKTLVLQSIGFGKKVDIPLLPKAPYNLTPTKVLHLPPGCEFGNHLVKIPFANPEDAVFVRAMKRGMMEFSTVDWGKMPTCEEKRLGSNPEKRPEKLTIRFR